MWGCGSPVRAHQLFVSASLAPAGMAVFTCECRAAASMPCLSVRIKVIYLGQDFTGLSSEAEAVKWRPYCAPLLIHLGTLGARTPLLCDSPSTGSSCCPPRTAAKLIHRDLSTVSTGLLGIVLGPSSCLSKSGRSSRDCTRHLRSRLDVKQLLPGGEAV